MLRWSINGSVLPGQADRASSHDWLIRLGMTGFSYCTFSGILSLKQPEMTPFHFWLYKIFIIGTFHHTAATIKSGYGIDYLVREKLYI